MSCLREFCILSLHRRFLLEVSLPHLDDDAQKGLNANIGLAPSVEGTLNAMDNVLVPAVELLILIASMPLPVADITAVNAQLLNPLVIVKHQRPLSLLLNAQPR